MQETIYREEQYGNTFFDVSNNPWLGDQNGIELMTAIMTGNTVIVKYKDGRFAKVNARNDMKRLFKSAIVRDTERADLRDHPFSQLAADLSLRETAFKQSKQTYKTLAEGETFFLVKLNAKEQPTQHIKATFNKKKSADVWDRKDVNEKGEVEKGFSSFIHPSQAHLLYTAEQHAHLQSMLNDTAYHGGYSAEEYKEAATSINTIVMLIAHALGKRASFSLHNYTTGVSSVTFKKTILQLEVTGIDTIDLVLIKGGQRQVCDTDLLARADHVTLSAIIPSQVFYSELAVKAYHLLKTA